MEEYFIKISLCNQDGCQIDYWMCSVSDPEDESAILRDRMMTLFFNGELTLAEGDIIKITRS